MYCSWFHVHFTKPQLNYFSKHLLFFLFCNIYDSILEVCLFHSYIANNSMVLNYVFGPYIITPSNPVKATCITDLIA